MPIKNYVTTVSEAQSVVERVTKKDADGHYYMDGDGIFSDWGVPERFKGEYVDTVGVIEDILGDTYDIDRLRELVEADKSERCVILGAKPDLRQGVNVSRCFIVEDDGGIIEDNVYSAEIGPDSSGKMNVIYNTFDSGDFELSEVGSRIFWDENTAKKASKANGQRNL